MALDFPSPATTNQVFSAAGASWKYDGTKWISYSATSGDITAVIAGTGLNGGATSGDATLNLTIPVSVANGGTGATTAAGAAFVQKAGDTMTGMLTVTQAVVTTGANAGFSFYDQTAAPAEAWTWYAQGGYARLWSNLSPANPIIVQNTTGYVGVGITPLAKLHVGGQAKIAVDNQTVLVLERANTTTSKAVILLAANNAAKWEIGSDLNGNNTQSFFIWDDVAAAGRFFIDAGGNVGIGPTGSLGAKLHVAGSAAGIPIETLVENTADGYAGLKLQANGKHWLLSKRTTSGEADTFKMYYHNGTSYAGPFVTVSTGGVLTLGNAPFGTLQADTAYTTLWAPDGNALVQIGAAANPYSFYRNTRHYFQDRAASVTWAQIDSTGLTINGASFVSSEGPSTGYTRIFDNGGGIAIYLGGVSPHGTYHRNTFHSFAGRDADGSPSFCYFDINGTTNVSGVWKTFSDASLKQEVAPYTRGLAAIRELKPCVFRYRPGTPFARSETEPSDLLIGLVAREVEPHVPEIVGESTVTRDGKDALTVATLEGGLLLYAVINALKEVAARLDALEAPSP